MSRLQFGLILLLSLWLGGWLAHLAAEDAPASAVETTASSAASSTPETTASSSSSTTPTEKSPERGHMVTLSDFGAEDLGYLSIPQAAPIGGVVLVHDRWGLDANTKAWADKLASFGYLTIAIDLYNGRQLNDAGLAKQVAGNLRSASALRTIQAGVRLLKESPRLKVSRVVLAGFGLGGEVSLRAAGDIKGLDAVAAVDPGWSEDPHRVVRAKLPACIIFARSGDETAPSGQAMEWQKVAQQNSKEFEMHAIEAKPGFADPSSPEFAPTLTSQSGDIMNQFFTREFSKPAEAPGIIDRVKEKVQKIF